MKICPNCSQTYADDSQNFCLNDGATLKTAVGTTFGNAEQPTVILNEPRATDANRQFATQQNAPVRRKSRAWIWVLLIFGAVFLLCGGGLAGLIYLGSNAPRYESNYDFNYNVNSGATNGNAKTSNSKAGLTLEKYNQIRTGMSYKQVVEILGAEGTELSSSEFGNYRTASYQWQGDDFQFIYGTFQNDKLLAKTQANLK
jgi:hypothetical protein